MKGKGHKKLSTPMIASIGAAALVLVLFLSFLFSSGLLHERKGGIQLPGSGEDAPVAGTEGSVMTAQDVADVEITAENAQKVIASLKRPSDYVCQIANTLYFTGGSSTLTCTRYARGDAVRTDTLDAAGEVSSTLLRDADVVYAWNAGDTQAFKGAQGPFTDDADAMLPTYEDVLASGVMLTAASRENLENDPCIRVKFDQGGYHCVYDISASSGLLKAASFYSGQTLTRQVTVSALRTDTPGANFFNLPDGTSVLGE